MELFNLKLFWHHNVIMHLSIIIVSQFSVSTHGCHLLLNKNLRPHPHLPRQHHAPGHLASFCQQSHGKHLLSSSPMQLSSHLLYSKCLHPSAFKYLVNCAAPPMFSRPLRHASTSLTVTRLLSFPLLTDLIKQWFCRSD